MLKWRTPRGPQLRYCAKLAFAAVAAYALTLGERNEYALYSVLGAALVMGGSVGEDLSASLNRVRGTLAGAIGGNRPRVPAGHVGLVARHRRRNARVAIHRAGLG